MKRFITRLLFYSLAAIQLSSCDKNFLASEEAVIPKAPLPAMADYLKYNYSFSMLYQALGKAGLLEMLSDTSSHYTLMAPDNAALQRSGITQDSIDRMTPDYLKAWLSYHLIPGNLPYNGIPGILNSTYVSVSNQTIHISKQPAVGGAAGVNSVRILQFGGKYDIPVYNGVVYVLEKALMLPAPSIKEFLQSRPEFSRFTMALEKFGLLDDLAGPGPFVVLAVNNNYFMSEDELATIDTFSFKKYLFDSHIMRERFFFHTDFQYRPVPENSLAKQFYIGTDGVMIFDNEGSYFCAPFSAGPDPSYWDYGLGDYPSLQFPEPTSYLTLNGTVITCTGMLVYSYNMMK